MRTAELAHQRPDGLAHGGLDEVELHQSRSLAEMAGFAVSVIGRFSDVHRGPEKWSLHPTGESTVGAQAPPTPAEPAVRLRSLRMRVGRHFSGRCSFFRFLSARSDV